MDRSRCSDAIADHAPTVPAIRTDNFAVFLAQSCRAVDRISVALFERAPQLGEINR